MLPLIESCNKCRLGGIVSFDKRRKKNIEKLHSQTMVELGKIKPCHPLHCENQHQQRLFIWFVMAKALLSARGRLPTSSFCTLHHRLSWELLGSDKVCVVHKEKEVWLPHRLSPRVRSVAGSLRPSPVSAVTATAEHRASSGSHS